MCSSFQSKIQLIMQLKHMHSLTKLQFFVPNFYKYRNIRMFLCKVYLQCNVLLIVLVVS